MLNQLNTTTKSELDEKYLTSDDIESIEDDIESIQGTLSDLQDDVTTLSNRVNTYLDTEQIVGRFGDTPLYQITIDCGLLWNSQAKTIETQIIVGDIISIDGVANSLTNIINLPHVGAGSGDGHIALNLNKDTNNQLSIVITSNSDRTSYHGFVTIQYTKPTQL